MTLPAPLDPDQLLAGMLAAIEAWEQAAGGSDDERDAAEQATAAAWTMHDWLSHGGALPTAWQAKR